MLVSLQHGRIRKRLGWRLGGLAVAMAVAGLTGLAALGWNGSEQWLRSPATPGQPSPAVRAPSAQQVSFPSRDGTPLAGWFIAGRSAAPGTIVLLHGLRSESGAMIEHAGYLNEAGYNVLLVDFRASGGSGGDETTFGAREQLDVLGALDYLHARGDVDMRRVGLQGLSMGGVVAVLVAAADRRVAAVVAEAPFSDFHAVVEHSYAGRPAPLRWAQTAATVQVLNQRLGIKVADISAVRAAGELSGRPLLVIENGQDRNVPPGSARAIIAAAGEQGQIWVIPDAAHGNGHQQQPEEYERRVLDFWAAAFGG